MIRCAGSTIAQFLLCLAPLLLAGGAAHGQGEAGDPTTGAAPSQEQADQANDLDKLLEMADQDVTQLSQVKVAGLTGSPSLDMPVTSVSRQESTVGRSAAAVFVITSEMIRRSGAKEIPEVLRMAPGVEVAKIDSSKWSVTIRGCGGRFASKLLVRIDGREVYTPSFAGTYWEAQDLLLEDVERIEVIRGPGGTLWGANAVNGVINIITKSARDTQGAYIETGTGTYQQGYASARYGGRAGKDLAYRVYGKWFDKGTGYLPNEPAHDAWRQARGGFRMDWDASPDDKITLQGDYYNGYTGHRSPSLLFQGGQIYAVPPYATIGPGTTYFTGENINLRWKRDLGEDSDWILKTYYDRVLGVWQTNGYLNECQTFDFDFQHRFPVGFRQQFIWGLEYRNTRDVITSSSPAITIDPEKRTNQLFSCFAQDEITLSEDLWRLTIGSKFEHNEYTGFEAQPSIRLLWTPDNKRSVWGSISRVVRTPGHAETSAVIIAPPAAVPPESPLPVYPVMNTPPSLQSEELIAYELGYREQTTEEFSWDLAAFINSYQRLINALPGRLDTIEGEHPYMVQSFLYTNCQAGLVYGAELAATWDLRPSWRLRGAYTYLLMDLHPVPGQTADVSINGHSPNNQVYLQSGWDLGRNWELDLIGRYVDNLPSFGIPSYIVGDVRLAWRRNKHLELSVVGRNLLKGPHAEYGDDQISGALHTWVRPEVYGQLVWRR